jgi:hypothetical protein
MVENKKKYRKRIQDNEKSIKRKRIIIEFLLHYFFY